MASLSSGQRPTEEIFFAHLQELAQSPSCQYMSKIVAENATLRDSLLLQEITNRTNVLNMGSLQKRLDDEEKKVFAQADEMKLLKEAREKAVSDLETERSAAAKSADSLEKQSAKIIALEKDTKQARNTCEKLQKELLDGKKSLSEVKRENTTLREALDKVRASDSEKAAELDRLASLEVKLKNHQVPPRDEIHRRLQPIFDSLSKLVESHIGEFKDSLLSQPEWKEFVKHEAFAGADLPWPPTNSANAKGMRRAGILCICAWALELHIFQSSHLVVGDNQLSQILDELAVKDPDREAYFRSILLRLQQDRGAEASAKRIDLAVEAVVECAHSLVADANDGRVVFETTLRNIFTEASRVWRHIQILRPKITASVLENTAHAWTLVPLVKGLTSTAAVKKPNQTPNGNSRADGDAGSKVLKKPAGGKVNAGSQDIMIALWPAILITDKEETKVLIEGYAVSEAELKVAREEESKAQESRRAARQNTRMVGPGRRLSASHSTSEKSNGGPSFLSQGVGSG